MSGADREATVRLTLGSDDFIVNMRRVGNSIEDAGKKVKKEASSWSVAFGGAKKSLGELYSSVGKLAAAAGGLGAAFSFGAATSRAIALREQFRDLEFQVNKTGKAQVNWNDLYQRASEVSKATGANINGIGGAMSKVFGSTGDIDFTRSSIQSVADAASATGKSIDGWANAAQILQRKFGASATTIADMMAIVVEKTDAGGPALEDLTGKFGLLAGEAVEAGFKGAEGLSALLGVLISLDSRVGEKSIPALKILFQQLKDGSASLKNISKESGIDFEEGTTAVEKLQKILSTERGRKTIGAKFAGENRAAFDELVKPFTVAFDQVKEAGGNAKAATDAGLKAFDLALKDLAKSSLTGAKLAEEGTKAVSEDPRVKLDQAVQKITDAMLNPKLIGALDKLADKLPAIAEWMAKLVEFAVDHPVLAGAAVVGGVAGKGAAAGVAGEALAGLGGVLKGVVWRDGGKAAGKAAADAIAADAGKAGKKIGDAAAGSMGTSGGLTKVGKVLAVAAVAEIAYELAKMGKEAIDADVEEKSESQRKIAMAQVATAEGVSVGKKKEALAVAKEELAKLEHGEKGAGASFKRDMLAFGTGIGSALGLISKEEAADARNSTPKTIERARARVAELEGQIAEAEKPKPATPAYITDMNARSPELNAAVARKMKIEDPDDVAQALARRLSQTTLKVVLSTPFDFGPSRGPISSGPPAASDFFVYRQPGTRTG